MRFHKSSSSQKSLDSIMLCVFSNTGKAAQLRDAQALELPFGWHVGETSSTRSGNQYWARGSREDSGVQKCALHLGGQGDHRLLRITAGCLEPARKIHHHWQTIAQQIQTSGFACKRGYTFEAIALTPISRYEEMAYLHPCSSRKMGDLMAVAVFLTTPGLNSTAASKVPGFGWSSTRFQTGRFGRRLPQAYSKVLMHCMAKTY